MNECKVSEKWEKERTKELKISYENNRDVLREGVDLKEFKKEYEKDIEKLKEK